MILKRLLILHFLGAVFLIGYGQQATNTGALLNLAEKLEKRHINNKASAVKYAREKGVPLTLTLDNGNYIELQFIENGRPVYYTTQNINAAISVRADKLWPESSLGFDLDGSGFYELGLWDAGAVRETHVEFNNTGTSRVIQVDRSRTYDFHSTHVAGTMIAGGVDPDAKGMAYMGNLKAWDWDKDESEIARAAAKGLEISNHSYGFLHGWSGTEWYGDASISIVEDFWFGFYSIYTQELDEIAYNAPNYLYVKSAGNDRGEEGDGSYPPDGNQGSGYDCVGTRACAKNILTVGSVEDLAEYGGPSSVQVSSYSAWGPVDDGRIKPDIVANGADLYSTRESSDEAYEVLYGTSMACAGTSGTLALLKEHYMNTHGGEIMKAATLKGLVIHTADECGDAPGPDYEHGWGLLNAEAAAEKISEDNDTGLNVIDELFLASGETYTLDVIADGTQDLVVTICWTDPPGTPVADQLDPLTPMLVNDLDLLVNGNSSTYYPWKLDPKNPSDPAVNTGENDIDNVETVYIPLAPAGTYTIEVSHDGDIGEGQYYSIIISGISPNDPPGPGYCDSHGNALNEWIEQVTIGDNTPHSSGSSGAAGYQDLTSVVFTVESNSEVPVTLLPGFDPRSTFEYWAIWIDFNADKDFEDEGELVFSSGKSKTGITGTISIPDISEISTRMRISMSDNGVPGPCDNFGFGEVEDYMLSIIQGSGPDYCGSEGLIFDQEWIAGVSIAGELENPTPGQPSSGYSYFEGLGTTLNELTEYSITLIPGFSDKAQREFFRVWIDYDGDMNFSAEELVLSADNKKSEVTAGFIVPSVSSKDTRMRVSMSRGTAPASCGDIDFGEVEDYLISLEGTLVEGGKAGMVDSNEAELFKLYPNPGTRIVNIKYTGKLDNAGLKIFNIQGSQMMDINVVSGDLKLDISDFAPGVYFLVFRSGEKHIYKKLIRQ